GGSITATRARISKLWGGAAIFDHHGMTEVGPVTYQVAEQPGTLVVMESSYLAEVITPGSGSPAAPGEEGELVLTTLQRTGSPILRYRTGDLVRAERRALTPDAPSSLCLDGGILGRTDDMVVVRGVNLFPSAIENVVRSVPEVAEYQVEIGESRAMLDIALRVEYLETCLDTTSVSKRLEQNLRTAFALRIPVHTASANTLPRFELKANRWIRHGKTRTGPTA
ncbi:MAG: phenylacetate--CoA ligase family protein, partial [Verrucomicrobia bacterium]|nr:phenylacetate--CoA ligase family protein [Verrucomicrobiota bacterium]